MLPAGLLRNAVFLGNENFVGNNSNCLIVEMDRDGREVQKRLLDTGVFHWTKSPDLLLPTVEVGQELLDLRSHFTAFSLQTVQCLLYQTTALK